MQPTNYSQTLLVDQSPEEVFKKVLDVRGWWSGLYGEEIEGDTDKLNEEFTFRAGKGAHYSKQKLIELIPDQNMTWLVTDSRLTFLEKQDEWTGSRIVFDISRQGDKTEVQFSHIGLTPDIECYEGCSTAWGQYIHTRLPIHLAR